MGEVVVLWCGGGVGEVVVLWCIWVPASYHLLLKELYPICWYGPLN